MNENSDTKEDLVNRDIHNEQVEIKKLINILSDKKYSIIDMFNIIKRMLPADIRKIQNS